MRSKTGKMGNGGLEMTVLIRKEECKENEHYFVLTGRYGDDEKELRCKFCGLYRYVPIDQEDGA